MGNKQSLTDLSVSSLANKTTNQLKGKGIKKLDDKIKEKLKRGGTRYDLKVIIRGANMTGKTTLFYRLQGHKFSTEHIKTNSIQSAHINWNYKDNKDDIVMVEVWDIVDQGQAKQIDIENEKSITVPALDATSVDVYKNTNVVIMIIDPTRKKTFDYAKKEIQNIPKGIDILLLINFRDLINKWVINESDIEQYLRTCDSRVKTIESSLKNGYGLQHFYNFLNVPFLKIKLKYLQAQIIQTKNELHVNEIENKKLLKQDYEAYLKWLTKLSTTKNNKVKNLGQTIKEKFEKNKNWKKK